MVLSTESLCSWANSQTGSGAIADTPSAITHV